MNEREYAAAMESMDNVHVDEKNAAIMGPMLVKRQEQKKYDFKNYMHENWNKDI
jgi:hypothetical protein